MRTREEQIEEMVKVNSAYLCHEDYTPDNLRMMLAAAISESEERAWAECAADTRRLDYLNSGCCDVRFRAEPIADTGDADTYCDVIEHHMAEPKERIVGSAYTIRAAIDAAMEGRNG